MTEPSGASFAPAELRAVLVLAAIYAARMLGLFLLLPVLALHVSGLPGGTPLLAGLAVGIYGLAQALLQVPFGSASDRLGRRPVILLGLWMFVAGSALGAFASSVWAIIAARLVQGCGAVSGPVMALLADLTREASRTRAMAIIGGSIGLSFVVSLVGGPALAAWVGVQGVFALMAGLGLVAIALVGFALPHEPARAPTGGRMAALPAALTWALGHYYAGVFVLHLSLTATFIAVPHALRDIHGLSLALHWKPYLGVFLASLLLTVPMVLWSERSRHGSHAVAIGAVMLVLALLGLALGHGHWMALLVGLVLFFGAFNFLEARLPAGLASAADPANRGAALGLFATLQFLGAFAGGLLGGAIQGTVAGSGGVLAAAAGFTLFWALLALAQARFAATTRA